MDDYFRHWGDHRGNIERESERFIRRPGHCWIRYWGLYRDRSFGHRRVGTRSFSQIQFSLLHREGETWHALKICFSRCAPRAIRGLLGLCFNIGMITGQVIGVFTVFAVSQTLPGTAQIQWQLPFIVQILIPVLGICLSFTIPETPRYLLAKGKSQEALAALVRIRNLPANNLFVEEEFEAIRASHDSETIATGGSGWLVLVKECFTVPNYFRRTRTVIIAYILAQFSGANSITNYLPTILTLIGVTDTNKKILFTGGYSISKLFCLIIASLFFVDIVGRRRSLLIGVTIQCGTLWVFQPIESVRKSGRLSLCVWSLSSLGVTTAPSLHSFTANSKKWSWSLTQNLYGRLPPRISRRSQTLIFCVWSCYRSHISTFFGMEYRAFATTLPLWSWVISHEGTVSRWCDRSIVPLVILLCYHKGDAISDIWHGWLGGFCFLRGLLRYSMDLWIRNGK